MCGYAHVDRSGKESLLVIAPIALRKRVVIAINCLVTSHVGILVKALLASALLASYVAACIWHVRCMLDMLEGLDDFRARWNRIATNLIYRLHRDMWLHCS